MKQDPRRRFSPRAIAALGVALAAGCSSSPSVRPPATPFSGVLPTSCIVANPPAARQVGGPVHGAASNGRFTRTVSLDGGALTVSPPPQAAHAAIAASLAECNLRAGLTGEGFPVEEAVHVSGLTFGLATVDVRDTHLTGHSDTQGSTGPGMAHPPALHPYHHRLAWVAIIQPSIAYACPAATVPPVPAPTPTTPRLPGYQVLVIDANTGADGLVYAAARNQGCSDGIQPPTLTPALEQVSVPWTLVSRNADGYSGTVDVSERSCDGTGFGDSAILVSRDHPGLVTAELRRPFNACGSPQEQRYALNAATVTSQLPQRLVHAPLGANDTNSLVA